MEKYNKPCLLSPFHANGIIPLAVVAGLSAAELAGIAAAAGAAVGMAATASSSGSNDIVPFRAGLVLQE